VLDNCYVYVNGNPATQSAVETSRLEQLVRTYPQLQAKLFDLTTTDVLCYLDSSQSPGLAAAGLAFSVAPLLLADVLY